MDVWPESKKGEEVRDGAVRVFAEAKNHPCEESFFLLERALRAFDFLTMRIFP